MPQRPTPRPAPPTGGAEPPRVQKTFYLPPAIEEQLRVRAAIANRHQSDLVVEALQAYFDAQGKIAVP